MQRLEIEKRFSAKQIPRELYWLDAEEGAEMQNGLIYKNGEWLVYYREKGILLNCECYDRVEDAVDALEQRLIKLVKFYQNIK